MGIPGVGLNFFPSLLNSSWLGAAPTAASPELVRDRLSMLGKDFCKKHLHTHRGILYTRTHKGA